MKLTSGMVVVGSLWVYAIDEQCNHWFVGPGNRDIVAGCKIALNWTGIQI